MLQTTAAKGVTLLAATTILLACVRPPAASEAPLSIGQTQFANVFSPSETIVIPVTTTADRILWSITDFFGLEVATGETVSDSGRASIVIERPAPGYFELEFKAETANSGTARARTTFVVVPPMDGATMEDSPFGVMTHFAQGWDTDVVPLIARAGIRHVRDEQYWAEVEQRRGRYSFPARLTRYMAELFKHDLEPLIVLSFANELYDEGHTPFSDDGRAGYARYGRAVLDRYGRKIQAVEIWNEYNGSFCKGPCRDERPGYYTRMLKQAYEELKRARPDIIVLGGAAVKIPLPYLEAIFQAGGLDYMDAVTVHPYGSAPEHVAREVAQLKQLMVRHGGEKPIWVTEIGRGSASPAGRREAARYLVRMFTALLSTDVERIYWYLLRDYQNFVGMGLLRGPQSEFGRYAPTPAYAAYANLIHQLYKASFVRREPTDPRTHIYLFDRAGTEIRVVWSTVAAARVRLQADETLAVLDIMGRQIMIVPERALTDLVVDDSPVYIVGAVRRIAEAGRDEILADSVENYSEQQGEAGWYYGHYDGDGIGEGDRTNPGAYTDDDFEPLERIADQWSHKWGSQRYPSLSIGTYDAHPSRTKANPVWAVRRWVSDTSGSVRVSGRVTNREHRGDGVAAHVLVDGSIVFSAEVGGVHPTAVDYALELVLEEGSLIDFAITPGPHSNIDFGGSQFMAQITRDVP